MLAQPLLKAGRSRCVRALMTESGSWVDGFAPGPVRPLIIYKGPN